MYLCIFNISLFDVIGIWVMMWADKIVKFFKTQTK
jgi:hypothetical protein